MRPSLVRAALVLAAAVLVGAAASGPAAAHSDLTASDPADGATLPAAPASITLTFSENVIAAGSRLVATGPAGAVALGATTVAGPRVSAGWPAAQPAGGYTVAYRVVSADGHPITGSIRFSVTSSPTSASPSPTAASPSPSPTSASASPSTAPASAAAEGGNPAAWLVGGLLVLMVAAGGGLVLSRRRR